MKNWLWLIFLPFTVSAQNVQITEIMPHTLAHTPEWFEFRVEHEGEIDLSGWSISNGSSTRKELKDHFDKLQLGDGVTRLADDQFEIDEFGYFLFQPSPVSLPNDGGEIQIWHGDHQLNQAQYGPSKSRSTKDYEEREGWAWDNAHHTFTPQLLRVPAVLHYSATPGESNHLGPTPLDRYQIVISEFSVDHDEHDFVELLIQDGPDQINLQYLQLKHNGTTLWHFESPLIVKPGARLVFKVGTIESGKGGENVWHTNSRDGLSGGSGTLELIGLSNTSHEKFMDFVCWQKQTLSQSEQKRVHKHLETQAWREACVDISKLIPNESRSRPPKNIDSNTKADWQRHFNGSPGRENVTRNQSPTAIIRLQGTKRASAEVPFQVNPTGTDSTDPDGPKDLHQYEWWLNDKWLSDKPNPAGFQLTTPGDYTLKLIVTDQSGEKDTATLDLTGWRPINRNQSGGTSNNPPQKLQRITALTEQNDAKDDYWAYILSREDWLEAALSSPPETPKPPPEPSNLYVQDWPRQINLPKPVRHRLKKNLGLLFSWRESPWPDLAEEWTSVVANDQKSGYFGGVYLGF